MQQQSAIRIKTSKNQPQAPSAAKSDAVVNPQTLTKYRLVIVALLALQGFSFGLNLFAVGPITPLMIDHFGVNNSSAGLLTSIVFLVHIVFAIPISLLVGRIGLKLIISLGALIVSITVLSFAATNSFTLLLVIRGICGLGFLFVFPSIGPLFMQWFRPKELPLVNGVFIATASLGVAIATLIVAPLSEAVGWELTLSGFGAFSLITAIAWMLFGKAQEFSIPESISLQMKSVWKVIWSRNCLLVAMADAGPLALLSVSLGWLPAFYHEVHGMSLAKGGILMGLLSFAGLVSLVLSSFLSTRTFNRRPFLLIPGILIGFAGLSVIFLAGSAAIYFAVVALGVICWFYVPALVTIPMDLYADNPRGVSFVFAALLSFGGIASFIAPPIVGMLLDITGSFIPGLVIFAVAASSLGIAGAMLPETGHDS